MIRVGCTVTGTVQGVGFRWAARAQAERLGVSGFARNMPNGSVELEIEGDSAAVTQMREWLAHGPPGARVGAVETRDLEPVGSTGFRIS
jgi:acylphosphatase